MVETAETTERHHPEDVIGVGEAARILGVSADTMRRYDIPSHLTPGGHRRYLRADVLALRATARPS